VLALTVRSATRAVRVGLRRRLRLRFWTRPHGGEGPRAANALRDGLQDVHSTTNFEPTIFTTTPFMALSLSEAFWPLSS
jgi:hypothetical protein